MKFIHIADVNLGAQPDRGRIWSDARAQEIYDSFHRLIQVCADEKIELLLIAGDLFARQPTENDLKALDFQLRKIPDTKTVILAGSADYIEPDSPWETFHFLSNTVVLPREQAASVYFEDLNVCVCGYSYGRPTYKNRILERMRPAKDGAYNILLGYGGDASHMPFSKEGLAQLGFQYVALGHMHNCGILVENQMAFAGSLEPLVYTETGTHGYILGEVLGDGSTTLQLVDFSARKYCNIGFEVSAEQTNGDVCEMVEARMKELGSQHIYRIMLRGIIAKQMEINLSELTRRYNINEIINKTRYELDIDEIRLNNETNLLGRLFDEFENETSDADEEIRSRAKQLCLEAFLKTGK
ncbi:MAG: exonuclease SbcCD subunit D [Wujia sp.]